MGRTSEVAEQRPERGRSRRRHAGTSPTSRARVTYGERHVAGLIDGRRQRSGVIGRLRANGPPERQHRGEDLGLDRPRQWRAPPRVHARTPAADRRGHCSACSGICRCRVRQSPARETWYGELVVARRASRSDSEGQGDHQAIQGVRRLTRRWPGQIRGGSRRARPGRCTTAGARSTAGRNTRSPDTRHVVTGEERPTIVGSTRCQRLGDVRVGSDDEHRGGLNRTGHRPSTSARAWSIVTPGRPPTITVRARTGRFGPAATAP